MWTFLIVLCSCLFILSVVKMGISHSENIERIKHGYPLISGEEKIKKSDSGDYVDVRDENRLQ